MNLFHIPKVPGPVTGYHETIRGSPQSLQVSVGTVL